MSELLDSDPHPNRIPDLVEEHIRRRRARVRFDRDYFISALQGMGKSTDEIHAIIVEMDNDADLELASGKDINQLNGQVVLGVLGALILLILLMVLLSGKFQFGILVVFPMIACVGAVFFGINAIPSIKAVTTRRELRYEKYQKWN